MFDIVEAHCLACGFTLQGLGDPTAARTCGMCGMPLQTRTNLALPRQLPGGLGLLMGAFAASMDASPLRQQTPAPIAGFARRWQ